MIKTNYFNSADGEAVCFDFDFFKAEYIPEKYFCVSNGQSAQALFFEDILKSSGLLRSKESKAPFADFYWNCSIEGVSFVMHHDAEWDTVDFRVCDEKYRSIIALKLSRLIEAYGRNAGLKVS